jgi:type VI secretion system protein ImpC
MPSRSEVHLDAGVAPRPVAPGAPLPDQLLPIALLGDFSGRAHRGPAVVAPPLSDRRPLRVDRDTLDQALARLAPEIPLALGGSPAGAVTVRFAALGDFHPDALLERLPVFATLRSLREPDREAGAGGRGAPRGADVAPPSPLDLVQQGDLLSRAVAATLGEDAQGSDDPLQAFVRRLVAPHLVREAARSERARQAQMDAASGALLREILHDPGVRALESLWRAVDFLVRRVDSDAEPPFYLVDVSQAEAGADLAAAERVGDAALFGLLGDPPGGRWAALVSDFTFGADPDDAVLAGCLAALARSVGAPWLAGASASLAGCPSLADSPDPAEWDRPVPAAWGMLRQRAEAAWLGLALPRFVLRLPYGPDSEPCERLDWRETSEPPRHDEYLWGNPAFACALLLAGRLGPGGTRRAPGGVLDIGDLPLHLYAADGETRAQPCAEVLLSERAAHRLLDVGLMPLVSLKDRDAVRLLRFQSFAEPARPLAGAWGGPGRA